MENVTHTPKYEVVFFDLYGTLIDIRTDEQCDAAWQALYDTACELGAQYDSVEALRERFEKLEAREMLHQSNHAIVRNGWDEFDVLPVYRSLLMNRNDEAERLLALPQAAQKAAWAFRQGSTSMIRLYPGALEMIEKLQEAGIVVALLSNAQSCYTRAELEMTGLASVLDDVIISSEEKIRKPARDLYMLALDREFVTAKHALMVGNDEKNAEAAAAATIAAVKQLSADVGIPTNLNGILKEEDIQFLAESAYADACRPGNPRDTSVEEIVELYKSQL